MRHGLSNSTAALDALVDHAKTPAIGHNHPPADDELLTAKEAANFVKLSIAAFWRNVCNRRLPEPVYPAPRAPRWWRSQLRLALEATRALPSDAKVARRQKRIAEERARANPSAAT
jgi:predicted DNA-binding transcriptional regulator AlpA